MSDRFLLWKFKRGDKEALASIYEKYVDDLFAMASSLLGDVHSARDVVQDVFESFARSENKVKLNGNLKSFLMMCVVNTVRYRMRSQKRQMDVLRDYASGIRTQQEAPLAGIIADEEVRHLVTCMGEIPYEQREAILLHIRNQMSFKEIAGVQNVSINTVQSRYRYGMDKLRSLLQSEVEL